MPAGRLCLSQVAQRVLEHYSTVCPRTHSREEAQLRTRMTMEDYTEYPDPCARLAAKLEDELAAYNAAPLEVQEGWWSPFIVTARAALSMATDRKEETRKRAFGVFKPLQALQRDAGGASGDVWLDIPVLPTSIEFADVVVREVPVDEKMRDLFHRRAWVHHLVQRFPAAHRAQQELEWLNQAIAERLGH